MKNNKTKRRKAYLKVKNVVKNNMPQLGGVVGRPILRKNPLIGWESMVKATKKGK